MSSHKCLLKSKGSLSSTLNFSLLPVISQSAIRFKVSVYLCRTLQCILLPIYPTLTECRDVDAKGNEMPAGLAALLPSRRHFQKAMLRSRRSENRLTRIDKQQNASLCLSKVNRVLEQCGWLTDFLATLTQIFTLQNFKSIHPENHRVNTPRWHRRNGKKLRGMRGEHYYDSQRRLGSNTTLIEFNDEESKKLLYLPVQIPNR